VVGQILFGPGRAAVDTKVHAHDVDIGGRQALERSAIEGAELRREFAWSIAATRRR
jgi:hypothetical protein